MSNNITLSTPANVNFDAYEQLVKEVKEHRQLRLVNIETFTKMSREQNVVILDTRSDSMYRAMHIKGAIHLDFSDFTQANLRKLIPDPNTKILIYCNNNFSDDASLVTVQMRPLLDYVPTKASYPQYSFVTVAVDPKANETSPKGTGKSKGSTKITKTVNPPKPSETAKVTSSNMLPDLEMLKGQNITVQDNVTPLTLALNIPTYINLYGYGYKNVYELSELIYISLDPRIEYEGTAVVK